VAFRLNMRMRLLRDSTLLEWRGLAKDGMDPLTGFLRVQSGIAFRKVRNRAVEPRTGIGP
jgi:hypothetical protein